MSPIRQQAKWKRRLLWILAGIVTVAIGVFIASWIWYYQQLRPVDTQASSPVQVTIESGSTPGVIAQLLQDEGVIRSHTAFLVYTNFEGVQGSLQAGQYELLASYSTQEVVERLVDGKTTARSVTFYPGATLANINDKEADDRRDVAASLLNAGYSQAEIDAGLEADYSAYNATLFQGRPDSADLEGYIYPETYLLASNATVEEVLRHSFDTFWAIVEEEGLVAGYEAQGLSLYEGITLASIIQKESIKGDEPKIAQVFLARLEIGMPLGSDVTYQYIADKTGVARDINLDSPYNTRRYTGLTPGPIASPGLLALRAVVSPATTDHLYFLYGDDGVVYFAQTLEEHEANTAQHCQIQCQAL